ncbi:PEP-CTERM sorting domain-containing protein [Cellvibrio sp. ARAG 10.3]|uniref:PEP-CTERM sorting domain-containing protein n=1 Tax=Cellvibrio sp. ARAG 10.3 TaxID=3451358 RepID=UPI003F47AA2F
MLTYLNSRRGHKRKKFFLSVSSCLALLWAAESFAVFINFDDIPFIPNDDGEDSTVFDDMPLTNQYESQGLLIDGGYLLEDPEGAVSSPNALLAGNFLTLSFINNLPTFVSMRVNSVNQGSVILHAYGAAGLIERQQTPGYSGPGDDYEIIPDLLVAFDVAEGISHITIEGFFNSRTSAFIDDLIYEYAVPAPATLGLITIGLLGLALQRRRSRMMR